MKTLVEFIKESVRYSINEKFGSNIVKDFLYNYFKDHNFKGGIKYLLGDIDKIIAWDKITNDDISKTITLNYKNFDDIKKFNHNSTLILYKSTKKIDFMEIGENEIVYMVKVPWEEIDINFMKKTMRNYDCEFEFIIIEEGDRFVTSRKNNHIYKIDRRDREAEWKKYDNLDKYNEQILKKYKNDKNVHIEKIKKVIDSLREISDYIFLNGLDINYFNEKYDLDKCIEQALSDLETWPKEEDDVEDYIINAYREDYHHISKVIRKIKKELKKN